MLDLFAALPSGAEEKDRVAAAAAHARARRRSSSRSPRWSRDPAQGHERAYLFWAVEHMRDPRAVDLCLEHLDDDALWRPALQALCGLRSQRARPVLERIAGEPVTRGRSEAEQRQRDRVKLAARGLERLDRAEAAGKARP